MENTEQADQPVSQDELRERIAKLELELSSLKFFCLERIHLLMGSDRDNRNSISLLEELATLFNKRLKILEGNGGQGGQGSSGFMTKEPDPKIDPKAPAQNSAQPPKEEPTYQGGVDQVLSQVNKMREKAFAPLRASFPAASRPSQ